MDMPEQSGIILAGGLSRRMGRDKAWVEFQGRPLIERVIDRLREVCQEIIVVANDQEPYKKLGTRLVSDILPGKGSLGGIFSGLSAAEFDRAVVVACDMPFLNPDLLRFMLTLGHEYDVVVPGIADEAKSTPPSGGEAKSKRPTAKDSGLHPLHAVYSKRCMTPIEARLRAGDLRIISFYPDVRVRVLNEAEIHEYDPAHLSLFNANTPEQLALAETLTRRTEN